MTGAGGAAFDADRQVGAQPQGLPGTCGVGGVARAIEEEGKADQDTGNTEIQIRFGHR